MKLQPVTLQSFKLIHTWVGLLAGLLLFIAFFAGTITLFRDAITHWQYQQNQLLTDESLALVPDFVDAIVAHDPVAQRGMRIALPGGHEPGLMAEWRKPDGEVGSAALNKDGSLHFGEEQSRDYSAERLPTLRQDRRSPRCVGTEVGLLPVIRKKQL